jgi:hypothetical protein
VSLKEEFAKTDIISVQQTIIVSNHPVAETDG